METPSTRQLRAGLVLVLLLGGGLAAVVTWGPLQDRRENARLKAELRYERQRLRALRGLVDSAQAPARRPAPPAPQTFSI